MRCREGAHVAPREIQRPAAISGMEVESAAAWNILYSNDSISCSLQNPLRGKILGIGHDLGDAPAMNEHLGSIEHRCGQRFALRRRGCG